MSARDSGGNPSAVAAATFITLSGKGAGTFYTDSSCTVTVGSSFSIAASTSDRYFYFVDSTTEALSLIAGSPGLTSGTLAVTVQVGSGAAAKLSLSGSNSLTAGSCSAYNLSSQDNVGNLSQVVVDTLVSLSGNGSGFYYSDSNC